MELLTAATAGDEQAFVQLTAPLRRRLHAHCYRMLGSVHDADDALQETMLRAWRGIGGFEPRAELSAWLYRIATNVCLRMIEQRGRWDAAAVDAHLQPYPDDPETPERETERRETIGLAFVTAMQLLPPKQRAAPRPPGRPRLVGPRDRRGPRPQRRGREQRAPARTGAHRARARPRQEHVRDEAAERTLMRRFVEAWEAVDIDRLAALLADDALMTMPPQPMRVVGPAEITGFFATVPMEGRLDLIRLRPTRANGQPALAVFVEEAPAEPHGRTG